MVKNGADTSDHVHLESVQIVEIPGETECGLLVGGFSRLNPYLGGPEDSFTGPVDNPRASCPDPTDSYEIWRHQQGKIERLKTDMGHDNGAPLLSLVEDSVTRQRYYLHSGVQRGRCHVQRRLPFTFLWQQVKGAWALMRHDSAEIENALFDQCGANDSNDVQCAGIAAMTQNPNGSVEAVPPTVPTTAYTYDLNTFLRTFRAPQFMDYQAAIMALDKPKLKQLQASGIPGDWTSEAIRRVGASSLPLPDKRKRAAWLFYEPAQLARALDSFVLESLLDWLPREDWTPIFKVIANSPGKYYGLNYLRQNAEKKGLTQLACDIDHVQSLICGETWGVGPGDRANN